MRWIITVVVAGKEQNSRPTDQTTPGQAADDIACPQDEERHTVIMMVFAVVALVGRKGC